ncbi:MAG TPA: tungstate ABC transporter substrate-binding protein WtpA [Euryarchaeota archaeon]|nr:tungstate ABC transporter substrate-binding protein WtpA [Euryarchaeota archaeon]
MYGNIEVLDMEHTKLVILFAILAVIIVISIVAYELLPNGKPELKIATAGSLLPPFTDFNENFSSEKGVNIDYIAKGSVAIYRDILELGRKYQVIALADVSLVEDLYNKGFVVAYSKFVTNAMILAYTDKSKYASEITKDNWYEIIAKEDVKVGFSNPNMDPCGYRALAVMALASQYYGASIFESIVENNTNIRMDTYEGNITINVPEDLEVNTNKITIRDKSVDLEALLQSGELDYAFLYRSTAKDLGFKYIELPGEINLGDDKFDTNYRRVTVNLLGGKHLVKIKTIVYGIGITKYGKDSEYVKEFIKFVYSSKGIEILKTHGFRVLTPNFRAEGDMEWLGEISTRT